MSIQELRSSLGDYAKDIKLNLGNVLTEEGCEGLNQNQILAIALACAYTMGEKSIVNSLENESKDILSEAEINAAKGAATIMAMNNIYYRFVHLVSDDEYGKMPAGLRMNIIGQPGVDKLDFELYSLAVSAINGCGMCMDAHVASAQRAGMSKKGIQSTIRIASVINAVNQAVKIN